MLNINLLFTQIFCFVIGLFLVNSSVQAGTIIDLNKAVVPLVSQDQRSQRDAYRTALDQVLIKLTGDTVFIQHPEYAKLRSDVMRFVTSTQFVEGQANQLLVIFNQDLLERWIKRNGLPLWGAQRPEGLLWLIEQSYPNKERLVLTDSSASNTRALLETQLFNRGITLDLPLMDIVDVNLVSEIDIWGQFIDTLHEGAQRYNTPYTVGVRLVEKAPDTWVLDYFVKSDMALRLQQLTGNSKAQLIGAFVSDYAQFQAQKYALDTARFVDNTQLQHEIAISGVTNITILSEIETYLTSLSIVEKAQLVTQKGFSSTFNIKLLGSPEQLHQILLSGNKVVPRVDIENQSDISHTDSDESTGMFYYQWR